MSCSTTHSERHWTFTNSVWQQKASPNGNICDPHIMQALTSCIEPKLQYSQLLENRKAEIENLSGCCLLSGIQLVSINKACIIGFFIFTLFLYLKDNTHVMKQPHSHKANSMWYWNDENASETSFCGDNN